MYLLHVLVLCSVLTHPVSCGNGVILDTFPYIYAFSFSAHTSILANNNHIPSHKVNTKHTPAHKAQAGPKSGISVRGTEGKYEQKVRINWRQAFKNEVSSHLHPGKIEIVRSFSLISAIKSGQNDEIMEKYRHWIKTRQIVDHFYIDTRQIIIILALASWRALVSHTAYISIYYKQCFQFILFKYFSQLPLFLSFHT